METEEHRRLKEMLDGVPWRRWGPYLSERQWGTVREDYSEDGNAWDYFPHDHARSRAYKWGEDGMCGICDEKMQMCFAIALWNGNDPFLKERLFGLTNSQGNHGEDVKEYYYYLDSTPTHSYMRMLYKYPARRLPVRRPGQRKRGARRRQARIRAHRHRHLRRRPLPRRIRRVRQGRAGRYPRAHLRYEPRARCCDAPRSAAPLVPQYVVDGARQPKALAARPGGYARRRRC